MKEPYINLETARLAKEKGYTYIFTSDALIVAPPSDDILPLVAAKLGIKIPTATSKPIK